MSRFATVLSTTTVKGDDLKINDGLEVGSIVTSPVTARRLSEFTPYLRTIVGGGDDSVGGTGTESGSNGPKFNNPQDMCLSAGKTHWFVVEGPYTNNCRIRMVSMETLVATTLAGDGSCDGRIEGTGASARFDNPKRCKASPDGLHLYVTDGGQFGRHTLYRVTIADGETIFFAGDGSSHGGNPIVDGTGTSAKFRNPGNMAISADSSTIYVRILQLPYSIL